MDTSTYETLSVNRALVDEHIRFLKEGEKCLVMRFDGEIVNLKGSPSVDLEVIESTPAVRGNTANSATKTVTVETGYSLNVPMFIQKGDVIKINTETGTYSGKAN